MYEPHPLMIDSGTFWRCAHGWTGWQHPCWRCGVSYPWRFVIHCGNEISAALARTKRKQKKANG
jgi:hypothetical protein